MKNICDEQWSMMLRTQIVYDDHEKLKQSLQHRPNTAAAALHYAVEYKNIPCLNIALEYCAGKRVRQIKKALTQAAEFDHLPTVKILFAHLGKTQHCNEALEQACINANLEMIDVLWERSTPELVLEALQNKSLRWHIAAIDLLQRVMNEKQAAKLTQIVEPFAASQRPRKI